MSKESAAAGAAEFCAARDLLLQRRGDQATAHRDFTWPRPEQFNWALDFFDSVAENRPDRTALWIVEDDGTEAKYTYRHLSERSNQVANWLLGQGVHPGDRIMLMLGNQVELWETLLAAVKLGAVVAPTDPALPEDQLVDRLDRADIAHVVCTPTEAPRFVWLGGHWTRICVGYMEGWLSYPDSEHAGLEFTPPHPTRPDDPLLLYFTSGTASPPRLVTHTHRSHPVGHLSTMYWLGVRPADVHLNVPVQGWAEHVYSSAFALWSAEATVLVVNQERFDPARTLDQVVRCGVATLCAPPIVWRAFVRSDLGAWKVGLREALSAGAPLAPDLVDRVREAWGITVRDGYGQTETTMVLGTGPSQAVAPGSLGGPLPGYDVLLTDTATGEPTDTGEICVDLAETPVGMMGGYGDDLGDVRAPDGTDCHHTGDIATLDSHGHYVYIGRVDDVFEASEYRISPSELESVLLDHEFVDDAVVVPSPDPLRLNVVKAYVCLVEGVRPDEGTARAVLAHSRKRLAPHKRVRRLEFGPLPRAASGKIRRGQLRQAEAERGTVAEGERNPGEYWEEDLPGLGD